MDRNLGAIGTDYTQSAACGLYYQWGRKDPFPYPASFSSNRPAPFVYHDCFRYEVIHPENSDPADVMTVDWAVKNPTSFIYKADYDVEEPEEDVLDWLLQPHHNLWATRPDREPISARSVERPSTIPALRDGEFPTPAISKA